MSKYGYEVPPMSWAEIDDLTNKIRARINFLSKPRFPILEYIEQYIADREGLLDYEIISLFEMPEDLANISADGKLLKIIEDTYEKAVRGEGRARFTLAHEFGHLVLHCNKINVFSLSSGQNVPNHSHSEKQADYFAASLLMPKKFFDINDTYQTIMRRHGVSAQAAKIRIKYLSSKGYIRVSTDPTLF